MMFKPCHLSVCCTAAGDVADTAAATKAALQLLRSRFHRVVWVAGNHELWVKPGSTEEQLYPDAFAKLLALQQVCIALMTKACCL